MEEFKITTNAASIEAIILAINELSAGMQRGSFEYTVSGILSDDNRLSEAENAKQWLQEHYDTAAGAFRLIAAASEIISEALVNDEIAITQKH